MNGMPLIDYDRVEIHRLKDKASPTTVTWADRWRAGRLRRRPRVELGPDVTVKTGVEVSVCETGRLSIGAHSYLHAYSWFLLTMPHPTVVLGKWVDVGRYTVIASKQHIAIGDYTVIAPFCYIIDHEHGFSAEDVILNQRSVLKKTIVGRDCYFGTGTVVLGGVTVGDGAIIGAGSVVKTDIPAYQVWAGNPARYVRDRL